MLNQVVIVGRIIEMGEYKEQSLALSIISQSPFKDENGEYKQEIIPVVVYGAIAEKTSAYCKKGNVVGIKGRIVVRDEKLVIDVDKITSLSSQAKED